MNNNLGQKLKKKKNAPWCMYFYIHYIRAVFRMQVGLRARTQGHPEVLFTDRRPDGLSHRAPSPAPRAGGAT